MTDTKSVSVQVGPGLPSLLFITFLVLKLTDVIDWSWWWVTAPLWGGIVIAAFLLVIGGIGLGFFAAIAALIDRRDKKKRRKRRDAIRASGGLRKYEESLRRK